MISKYSKYGFTLVGAIILLLTICNLYSYSFDLDFLRTNNQLAHLDDGLTKLIPQGKKYKVGIIVQKVTLGEREVAQHYKIAIENLGWDAYVFKYKAKFGRYKLTAWVTQKFNDLINYFFQPDLLILLYPSYYPVLSENIPKYLIIFNNITDHLKLVSDLKKLNDGWVDDYQNIGNYNGYIDLNNSSAWVKELNTEDTKIVVHGYPSTFATKYNTLAYERLFYCGGNWDNLRSSENYQKVILGLEDKGYLDVYGPSDRWQFITKAYKGFIENDGHSLIQKIRDSGIALVLHSDYHNANGIPSARVFEAAAAGAVIISDQNAFVKREFGSCALYIDPTQTPQKVIEDIDAHMQWIKSNPIEANQKAQCAHNIFNTRFSLEKLLLQLVEANDGAKKSLPLQ